MQLQDTLPHRAGFHRWFPYAGVAQGREAKNVPISGFLASKTLKMVHLIAASAFYWG
jgi:hypothetical protein